MTDGLRTFDGAVAIVTRAGSGIGRPISEALARRRALRSAVP
jgi:NAD(P)-dependent dehydrogenase (short-subunit alcohol dehydrogenase family)